MKRLLFITLSLLHGLSSMACFCAAKPRLERIAQVQRYSFVALVHVTDKIESVVKFRIKELFKGDSLQEAYEPSAKTSCNIGISKGQEWLLFGYKIGGKLIINACDRNTRNHTADELVLLRHMFRKDPMVYPDGMHITYYTSGRKAFEENYLNNQLHGERKIWYPDGQLNGRECYTHDRLDGKSEWFYASGQIKADYWYSNGKSWNTSRTYYDTAVLGVFRHYKLKDVSMADYGRVQMDFQTVYNTDGTFLLQREYSRSGKIINEHIMKDSIFSVRINYYDNGTVRNIANEPFGECLEFNKDGSLKQ